MLVRWTVWLGVVQIDGVILHRSKTEMASQSSQKPTCKNVSDQTDYVSSREPQISVII